MIISFYDKDFKAIKDNSGLVIAKDNYSLIKRPVEMNDFTCICEPFIEDIQPTFLVVKDDKGSNKLVYSSLAGIPIINKKNQTEVNATDIKSMLSSDIIIERQTPTTVNQYIKYIFNEWKAQVNQNTINCELVFNDNVGDIAIGDYKPEFETFFKQVNAWEELQPYLRYYKLFMDTELDLVNKKVKFIIGRTMFKNLNIKLWEYGIKNYGKWISDVNECQGYYSPQEPTSLSDLIPGTKWILTSQNNITTNESNRDIFPIKRKVVISNESIEDANTQALSELLNSLYNEDIELSIETIKPDFETNFAVFVRKGEEKYYVKKGTQYYNISDLTFSSPLGTITEDIEATRKIINEKEYYQIKVNNQSYLVKNTDVNLKPYKFLPCGELQYDASGLVKFKIGYRYTDVKFI